VKSQTHVVLNLDQLNAAKLIVPLSPKVRLILIGCGGTGSWLAPAVARVARLLNEKFAKDVLLGFVDPDEVEAKNIYRQNFCRAEVECNKAIALATRYGAAWGVNIVAFPQKFGYNLVSALGGYHYDDLTVLIGCVDNPTARRDIQSSIRNIQGTVFWLDSGNVKESGQVLIGRNDPGKEVKIFPFPEKCAWVPLPSRQHKELVGKETDGDSETESAPVVTADLSCAEIAMLDEQGLAINQAIASVAADYLVRLLLTQTLDKFQTYIDLNSGSMKSTYITPANVRKWKR
jgi:PRTRC genetic system ThiF family protein